MHTKSVLYKFWIWYAQKILGVPYVVNFQNPADDIVMGIGFAWSKEQAQQMLANYQTLPQKPSRTARRAINRAARKALIKGVSKS